VARVGHTGGKLVYQYNAASAYAAPTDARLSQPSANGGDGAR
jgi:hypothetical protein